MNPGIGDRLRIRYPLPHLAAPLGPEPQNAEGAGALQLVTKGFKRQSKSVPSFPVRFDSVRLSHVEHG